MRTQWRVAALQEARGSLQSMKKRIGTRGGEVEMQRQMVAAKKSRRVKQECFGAWKCLLLAPPCSPSLALRVKTHVLRAAVRRWRNRVDIRKKVGNVRLAPHVTRQLFAFIRCLIYRRAQSIAVKHQLSRFYTAHQSILAEV
jgi:hypothetical protein